MANKMNLVFALIYFDSCEKIKNMQKDNYNKG